MVDDKIYSATIKISDNLVLYGRKFNRFRSSALNIYAYKLIIKINFIFKINKKKKKKKNENHTRKYEIFPQMSDIYFILLLFIFIIFVHFVYFYIYKFIAHENLISRNFVVKSFGRHLPPQFIICRLWLIGTFTLIVQYLWHWRKREEVTKYLFNLKKSVQFLYVARTTKI